MEHGQRHGPTEGRRLLIDDVQRFDGVKVIGVDEHVWRHTRRGDKYALTSARLLATDVDNPALTPLLDVAATTHRPRRPATTRGPGADVPSTSRP